MTTQTQTASKQPAPAGVTVSIDDNEMMLRVTGANFPPALVSECHRQAGELGYGIEFVRV